VLVVFWCVNIMCVCTFILCDSVHVYANIYVAICTITCKAHQTLWHCLFSTRYSEHQLLYHINCKHLLLVQQFSNELFPCGHPTSGIAFTAVLSAGQQNSSTVKASPVHTVGINGSRCVAALNTESTFDRVVVSLTLLLVYPSSQTQVPLEQQNVSSAELVCILWLWCVAVLLLPYVVTVVCCCVTVTVFIWCVKWI
jgi:hypothetical protein